MASKKDEEKGGASGKSGLWWCCFSSLGGLTSRPTFRLAGKADAKKDSKQAKSDGFVHNKTFNLKEYIKQYTGITKVCRAFGVLQAGST
jgi:hypothetical protein